MILWGLDISKISKSRSQGSNLCQFGLIFPFPDDNSTAISVIVIKPHGKFPLIWTRMRFFLQFQDFLNFNINKALIIMFSLLKFQEILWFSNFSLKLNFMHVWVKNPIVFKCQGRKGQKLWSIWARFLRFRMITPLSFQL